MSRQFATSGWKWSLLVLAAAAIAPLYLRNSTAATQSQGAGVPDTGAQLQALVDELKITNQKLDALQKTLDSGKLQVQATIAKDPQ